MTASNTSPFPGKQGACFTMNAEGKPGSWKENLPKIIALKTYWTYTWGFTGYNELQNHPIGKDKMWVPMAWGCPPTSDCDSFEKKLKDNNVHQLIEDGKINLFFGFNEPDEELQSNVKVEHALKMWSVLEKLNVPLVSPSCAHPGKEWMQTFMNDVKKTNKRVDYVGVHWYGPCNFNKLKADLTLWHEMYERPLIITEFAPADWKAKTIEDNKNHPSKILEFMKLALPWLEETEWIAGYSWFSFQDTCSPGCSSALFDSDGNLTAIGKYYMTVNSDKPTGNRSIEAIDGPFYETHGKQLMKNNNNDNDNNNNNANGNNDNKNNKQEENNNNKQNDDVGFSFDKLCCN